MITRFQIRVRRANETTNLFKRKANVMQNRALSTKGTLRAGIQKQPVWHKSETVSGPAMGEVLEGGRDAIILRPTSHLKFN